MIIKLMQYNHLNFPRKDKLVKIIHNNLFEETLMKIVKGFMNYNTSVTLLDEYCLFETIKIKEFLLQKGYIVEDIFIDDDTVKNIEDGQLRGIEVWLM